MNAVTMASTSSRFSTRRALVAKRASSPSASRPSTAAMRRHILSLVQAIATQPPSPHSKWPCGQTLLVISPSRGRTKPVAAKSGAISSSTRKIDS